MFGKMLTNKFNQNVAILLVGTVMSQAIPIAISPILTRIYSPSYFGLFAFYFRLDSNHYTLCGTENSLSFAVEVQDLKNWEDGFELLGVKASALTRGQPEVLLTFDFFDKKTSNKFSRKIRSEVRWSHGKFCGNPEAKLYKHDSWSYSDLPWAKSV